MGNENVTSAATAAAALPNYVAGAFRTSGRSFVNTDPVDGSSIGNVSLPDEALVNEAVTAARNALAGAWGTLSEKARSRVLHRIADGIDARFEEFVAAEMRDTGESRWQATTTDIPRAAANFRLFADLLLSRSVECFHSTFDDGREALNYSVHKPLGVVGVIAPWNLPLLLLTWKLGPAMAAGNAVIAKPSEETPSSATLLAEVMHEAEVPAGAFNLLHGFGPNSTGEWLSSHPGIDAITFTGESRTGSAIMRSAADNVKALSFELGGKNAALIFADCDFQAAIDGTVQSVFTNGGQVCMCTERVYVQRPIFDRFVAAMKERAEALRIDWPDSPETDLGPLISAAHREKVLEYYRLAQAEGGSFVTGGGVPKFGDSRDAGAWVQPTIVTGLPETARSAREEVFGPFCHITPFDTDDEAVVLANDSAYGLAATVWTSDLKRAHRVARRLETGIVWVNTWYLRDLRTPFGGVKLSGVGREGGLHSLNFYAEPTNICIRL